MHGGRGEDHFHYVVCEILSSHSCLTTISGEFKKHYENQPKADREASIQVSVWVVSYSLEPRHPS